MPAARATPICLVASDRHRLGKMAYGHKTPYRDRVRATIVLAAARGHANNRIAEHTGMHVDTVRRRRDRFAAQGMAGLADRKRSGRPPRFTPVQIAEVKALACQMPAQTAAPPARWSCPELARQAAAHGVVTSVSPSTVRRRPAQDALKPWQHRSWILIRDPDFATKGARVLDLYGGIFDGEPLGPDEHVVCADEKTSIQARCHPTPAPGQARAMRVNHEYHRGGATAYLAAWDVHRGQVFGRREPTTGIAPFQALVEQVMSQEPYAGATRVFRIVDNGSSHRGKASVDRMATRWPNAVLIHTPLHASRLNQVEIYFSVVQRKVVAPNDFTDLDQLRDRLQAFEDRYNATAQPFQWKFTTTDLDDLPARLDKRREQEEHPRRQPESSLAQAA